MEHLSIIILVSVGTGFFTALVNFCMGDPLGQNRDGRIFSWLGRWLRKQFDLTEDRHERWNATMMETGHEPRLFLNWWKVLICPTCLNVWLTTFNVLLTVWAFGLPWGVAWWLPVGLGFSFWSVEKAR